jgi:hypothetical protein
MGAEDRILQLTDPSTSISSPMEAAALVPSTGSHDTEPYRDIVRFVSIKAVLASAEATNPSQ